MALMAENDATPTTNDNDVQLTDAPERDPRRIFDTPADLVAAGRITALAARRAKADEGHRMGHRVMATVTRMSQEGDAYASYLATIDLEKPRYLRMTRAKKGEALVALGERFETYYTSQRADEDGEEGLSALWMLAPMGEPRVVLRRPGGISKVAAAGRQLWLIAPTLKSASGEEDNTERFSERKKAGVSAILHEYFPVRYWDHDLGPAYPRLYRAPLPDFNGDGQLELTELPIPDGKLEDFQISPDGALMLITVTRNASATDPRSCVYIARDGGEPEPLAIPPSLADFTGSVDELVCAGEPVPPGHGAEADADGRGGGDQASPAGARDNGQWTISYSAGEISPDGTHAVIYANSGNRDGHPMTCWAELVELATGERRRLAPDFDDWPKDISWIDNSRLVMSADRRGRASLYRIELAADGADQVTLITDDDWSYNQCSLISAVDTAGDARAVALRSSVELPPQIVTINLESGATHEEVEVVPVPEPAGRLTEVTAHAEDGTELRAWLMLPENTPDGGAPLLTFAHGGPWGSWNDWTWRWNPGPFVKAGYAVLLPDPAISTGYGQHMIDRGNDSIGDAPYTDILALIDATEARADIDSSRTALLGGSYGGYMANWMAGHTGTRFKCIVTHAALWDIDSMSRNTDNGVWHEWHRPTQAGTYSPHTLVGDIQVPMLVIHGDKDYRVPFGQGLALWHALLRDSQAVGHKFLYYPDENHWILKPTNSQVWYETVLAFVNHHVLGEDWQRPHLLG